MGEPNGTTMMALIEVAKPSVSAVDVLGLEELVIKEVSTPVVEEGALIADPVAPSPTVEVAEIPEPIRVILV